jgi:hypothetical protein
VPRLAHARVHQGLVARVRERVPGHGRFIVILRK